MKGFVSKNKNFIICCLVIAAVYLLDSLLFFSQMYLLYNYFDTKTIGAVSTGWAYLAQGVGVGLFVILYKTRSHLSARRMFQVASFIIEVPVIIISILVPSGLVLMFMVIILNVIVGLHTGFTFTLAAVYVPASRLGICYGMAYAFGALGTWITSLLSEGLMTSYYIIFIDCILIALIVVFMLMYKDAVVSEQNGGSGSSDAPIIKPELSLETARGRKILILLCVVIAIMAPISSIGTNNVLYVEYCREINLLAQRSFYAVGLIAAGLIFDKNRIIGGVCAVVSLAYPVVLTMIYQESGLVTLVIGLSYVILGFFAVYRAASFMTLASESKKYYMAPLGLGVARVCEAVVVLMITEIGFDQLTSVIMVSVLFIPLVILFFLMVKEKYSPFEGSNDVRRELSAEERRAAFAGQYGLTRREEEISMLVSEGRSNGEIAELLKLSENTIRFHVSNILKKTGMKDRNEVSRAYRH
ncbi:MAG: LuxR C-terminal-related transcriptional regulator [Lachnospiraceae bacterium]|nr:LuxR C-terminal-related transcriptional regulator [Lachnospiraceae bacterium]